MFFVSWSCELASSEDTHGETLYADTTNISLGSSKSLVSSLKQNASKFLRKEEKYLRLLAACCVVPISSVFVRKINENFEKFWSTYEAI